MSWSFDGTFYENCSCEAICPCTWSNGKHAATHDYCRATIAFSIERGHVEGVDVGGRTVVMTVETPAQMLEGNWKAGVIIDEDASEEQATAIGRVMGGELGGPPAALGPLLSEFLGVATMPVAIESSNGQNHIRIGDAIEFTQTPELSEGEPVQITNVHFHPAASTVQVASVQESKVSAFGIEWSGTDLSGFTGPFHWEG